MFDILNQYGVSDVHLKNDPTSGLQAVIAIHDTTLGPAVGGCRLIRYTNQEDALIDAARLARGMTYKAALAGLPAGGGKAVILSPPEPFERAALFRSFGDFIDSLNGRYVTALDSGTNLDDMDIVASRTRHVSSSTLLGDCSLPTARGIFSGIQVVYGQQRGHGNLQGARVAIQGLGHVGMNLARLLHQAGAQLIVSDIDTTRADQARERFNAQVVPPEHIYAQPCDIFAPCGLGGVINETTIDLLRCPIIAGAANNQLADESLAEVLQDRGMLYIPDFAINAGGLIYALMKYRNADDTEIEQRLSQIPATITALLHHASRNRTSPWHSALKMAEAKLQGAGKIPVSPAADAPTNSVLAMAQ